MVDQEGNIADITRPKTHIDELVARYPVPDALDMAEANKTNRQHAAAIRNVVGAGRFGGYSLDTFKLNRDIRSRQGIHYKAVQIYGPAYFKIL